MRGGTTQPTLSEDLWAQVMHRCAMGTAARCGDGVCLKRVASNTLAAASHTQKNSV